ncbi:MAG TPA: hypothetical protein VLE43_16560 [Candidatus Saccharimonadia bacterium]|nr:hypothetical protein [Candidatus Saccharimonadia bacterium]
MNATFADWQSWAALVVVVGTALIFLRRALRGKKKAAGCSSCGSGSSSKPALPVAKRA